LDPMRTGLDRLGLNQLDTYDQELEKRISQEQK